MLIISFPLFFYASTHPGESNIRIRFQSDLFVNVTNVGRARGSLPSFSYLFYDVFCVMFLPVTVIPFAFLSDAVFVFGKHAVTCC